MWLLLFGSLSDVSSPQKLFCQMFFVWVGFLLSQSCKSDCYSQDLIVISVAWYWISSPFQVLFELCLVQTQLWFKLYSKLISSNWLLWASHYVTLLLKLLLISIKWNSVARNKKKRKKEKNEQVPPLELATARPKWLGLPYIMSNG